MLTDAEGRDIVERIRALADCAYWAKCGWDIPGDSTQVIGRLAVKAADAIEQYRAAWLHAAGQAAASGPRERGYAHLGIGAYIINHTRADQYPELVITLATEHDKATRTIGDSQDNAPDSEIAADDMIVRLAFKNVEGLDALEAQLKLLRDVHFTDHTDDRYYGFPPQEPNDAAPAVAQDAAQDQSETECRDNPNTPLHDWLTREATRGEIYEQCAWCHNTRTPLPKDQILPES